VNTKKIKKEKKQKQSKSFLYFKICIMQKQLSFYLWLNDKDTKLQKYWIVEAYKVCMNLVWDYFWWWTIHDAKWFYKHDDGTVVIENSLLIITVSDKNYIDFVENLKKIFNQESIMVSVIENPSVSFL